jgi:arylsulfatase A-like enzyme
MTFARNAIVYLHATSPATNTSPSITALLGGRPVTDLIPGGNVLRAFEGDETTTRTYNFGTPVPHRFRLAGYVTSAINPFALFADGDFQRLAGFDAVNAYPHDQVVTTAKESLMSAQIVDGIVRQLRSLPDDKPMFLWAHIPDLHAPYLPPGRGREPGPDAPPHQRAYLRAVGYVDNQLGRLLATLHAERLDARYAIVITCTTRASASRCCCRSRAAPRGLSMPRCR